MSKGQCGFTLVEIIAVLVVLGILAAVAVPKYLSLQNDAEVKAALAAKNEAQSRLYQLYYSSLLRPNARMETSLEGRCRAAWTEAVDKYADDLMTTPLGDWQVFFDQGDSENCFPVYSIAIGPVGNRHQVDLSSQDLTKSPWLLCAPQCE